ncbi:MAG: helix-turn-helix domain-containing protein [Galactobacter sp.]
MGDLRRRLGANLRRQRRHWSLSQEALAHRVGLSPRYVAGIERGERNLTLDTLDEVAGHLGLDPVELISGTLRDELPEEQDGPVMRKPVGRRVVPRPYPE